MPDAMIILKQHAAQVTLPNSRIPVSEVEVIPSKTLAKALAEIDRKAAIRASIRKEDRTDACTYGLSAIASATITALFVNASMSGGSWEMLVSAASAALTGKLGTMAARSGYKMLHRK
ncbi:MAG: hypothetical protein M1611_00375 [Candidatus Marsarchaeota archaeon]|jgi:hypothetical protein|nr:hypothetical protein [Candidatus Marsarchaeota archaeon]